MSDDRREACVGCGEETATGSLRFSGRRTVSRPGRPPDHVCEFCLELAAQHRHGRRMSDDELRAFIDNASKAGMAWGGRPFS